ATAAAAVRILRFIASPCTGAPEPRFSPRPRGISIGRRVALVRAGCVAFLRTLLGIVVRRLDDLDLECVAGRLPGFELRDQRVEPRLVEPANPQRPPAPRKPAVDDLRIAREAAQPIRAGAQREPGLIAQAGARACELEVIAQASGRVDDQVVVVE